MDRNAAELLEKIRQQFDNAPYPRVPLDLSPKEDTNALFTHNLVTSFYLRNQQVISTAGKTILDLGCGSGYKSLILAEANPNATIVGIDLSEKSVQLAQERLKFHGFEQTKFLVCALEELPDLGMTFDYINCDEVLYLVPDLGAALQTMKSVLKPEGIIRSNLHSLHQRQSFFRAQQLFKFMGLMEANPEDMEVEIVLDTMRALKTGVPLKATTWTEEFEGENQHEQVLMNYLFQGDKGYTIPDLFAALSAADLEFVSMVNWRHWELLDLFQEPDNLPVFWAMSLPDLTIEAKLHIYELLCPVHRLLDFWCGHPGQARASVPPPEWTQSDWLNVQVHLHPQLKTSAIQADLLGCIDRQEPFEISRYLSATTLSEITLSPMLATCLLPLWEQPQSGQFLVERFLAMQPIHPATQEPMSIEQAWDEIRERLIRLEILLYVLLQRSDRD